MVASVIASPSHPTAAIELRDISKTFGATQALRGVSLDIARGEIHGLIGLNGSGKSTLVKVLSGYLTPDPGASARLWGQKFVLPLTAPERHGIAVVQQDLALNRDMSVLDNVNVGQVLTSVGGRGRLRRSREATAVAALLDELGSDISPRAIVASLSAGQRAIVSIARALATLRRSTHDHACLVLDEPTAYLTADDSQRLFAAARRAVSGGGSAIIISHRLDDIIEVCGTVSVLREGRIVESGPVTTHTKATLTSAMAGRETRALSRDTHARSGRSSSSVRRSVGPSDSPPPRLAVRGLSGARLSDVTFAVRSGEVLACTGLLGSGIGDLPYAIGGLRACGGRVLVDGASPARGVRGAQASGVRLVPEDRLGRALWSAGSVAENLTIGDASLGAAGGLFVRPRAVRRTAERLVTQYEVVTGGPSTEIAHLSGGNQQKLVIARALAAENLSLLVLHEPTSGVDVHARASIYQMIAERVRDGIGVLLCSSDIEEVVALADRVLVFDRGRVVGELEDDAIEAQSIALMCQRGSYDDREPADDIEPSSGEPT